jgi:hypothetical protein
MENKLSSERILGTLRRQGACDFVQGGIERRLDLSTFQKLERLRTKSQRHQLGGGKPERRDISKLCLIICGLGSGNLKNFFSLAVDRATLDRNGPSPGQRKPEPSGLDPVLRTGDRREAG